jgi:tripartite-type tricarboxylate transporter receptor subunit TctC
MEFPRRRFLYLAAGAAALPPLSHLAWAQSYPLRPVRIIVGFAPGTGADILARLMGHWLSGRLGQQFFIENRPGAGTNLATEAVVRAAPDGYTLLAVSPANAINATLYDNLNFNFLTDITPVASILRTPNVMLVNPSVPAKSVPEFIAYAKANPGKISFASAGNGSGSHMSGELFKMMTGIDIVHIPYRGGGPALADLLAGQVQLMFPGTTASIPYIRAGTLRALAVTTTTRSELLPDIPTVGDFVPGYESSLIDGVGAPRDTPPEIIDRLNKQINASFADPKLRAQLADLGGTPLPGSPAEFAKLMADETGKWEK